MIYLFKKVFFIQSTRKRMLNILPDLCKSQHGKIVCKIEITIADFELQSYPDQWCGHSKILGVTNMLINEQQYSIWDTASRSTKRLNLLDI